MSANRIDSLRIDRGGDFSLTVRDVPRSHEGDADVEPEPLEIFVFEDSNEDVESGRCVRLTRDDAKALAMFIAAKLGFVIRTSHTDEP